jgi:hypothetical protein
MLKEISFSTETRGLVACLAPILTIGSSSTWALFLITAPVRYYIQTSVYSWLIYPEVWAKSK